MPVLSKQIEKNLLLWMLSNHLLVEFYSKSWPLREREVSFYYAGISRCGRFYPILSKVVKVFLNLEVGCGCRKVERCCSRNRPASITNSLNQCDCLQLLAPGKLIKACTERIELERMVAFLNRTFGRVMEFLRSAFDRVPAIRIGFDLISHRATQEFIDRLSEHLPHNIPAGDLNGRDGGHSNLACTRIVVQIHPSHQVFDIDWIMTQDMVWYGFRKISQKRLGMVQHPYPAHTFQSVVGDDTHEGQIAPGSSHDSTFDINNFHASPALLANSQTT